MVHGLSLHEARSVVELGPGTGVFTTAIQRELSPHAELLCLEINSTLARGLAARVPAARVVNDSAENLETHVKADQPVDCVISGLPWVILSDEDQRRLLEPVVRVLRPGGRFATFGYSHGAWLPAGRRFRALLERVFETVETSESVWKNFPPAFVYRCRK